MQKTVVEAAMREEVGKGAARRARAEGRLPGVLYGGGDSVPISLDRRSMVTLMNTGTAAATLITLKLDGKERIAIIRDYQATPAKNELQHVDFMEVAMDKAIQITVPLMLAEGDPVGVKEGGILQMPMREVVISCLPTAIPEHVIVDALGLNIGETLHMSDVKMPDGVTLVGDSDQPVVSITAPVSEEELEQMLTEGEEAAEPAVAGEEGAEAEAGGEASSEEASE